MKDAPKTIGNLIDSAKVSIISSVDEEGYPNTKNDVTIFCLILN